MSGIRGAARCSNRTVYNLARWVAVALLVAAVLVGVLGYLLLPRILVSLLFVMLIWAAGTISFRTIAFATDRLAAG
jgi:hypothetical protein